MSCGPFVFWENALAIAVRTARSGDLAAVDAVLARAYPRLLKPDYPPSVLVTALPLISRAQPSLLASGTYYVVEDDAGQVVGAGGWTKDRASARLIDTYQHMPTSKFQVVNGFSIGVHPRRRCRLRFRHQQCLVGGSHLVLHRHPGLILLQ